MTDRELLELAAKAAGIGWRWFGATFCVDKDREMGTFHPWNPLTDDGDALRLAVRLRLKITVGNGITMVENPRIPDVGVEFYEGDEAATRRAIVRAAAAIGKAR